MINNKKEFENIEIRFNSAINSVGVEKGLSNVDAFKQKYQEAFNEMYAKPHIAFGNKKLPKTTAIYNIGTWFLCEGRLKGFCELHEVCYAKCREIMGNTIKSRLNNYYFWKTNDAQRIANFIVYSIKAESMKEDKINLLRFNEVGEFENQEDLEKMVEISNIVYNETNVNSYTYTHNRELDFNIDRPHLTINGSGFMIDNQFSVVPPSEYKRYVESHNCFKCPQKCEMCNSICSQKLGIEIVEVEK